MAHMGACSLSGAVICAGSLKADRRVRSDLPDSDIFFQTPPLRPATTLLLLRAAMSSKAPVVAMVLGGGSGSALPFPVLLVAGICTLIATFVSAMSILLHLKNYRKPHLQRYVSSLVPKCRPDNSIPMQTSYTNHAHGPALRSRIFHIIILPRGSVLYRCCTRHLRSKSCL